MLRPARIALVQRGLADDDRPMGTLAANRPQRGQRVLLGVVHGLQHHDEECDWSGEGLQIVARVVARFAQPAGIEEAEEAALLHRGRHTRKRFACRRESPCRSRRRRGR